MIEIIIKNFIDSQLTVPCFSQMPENTPDRFVVFEKTGSDKKNHLPSATIAFQSYAESKYEAAKLNEELKEVVEDKLIALNEIRGINLNSDYDYTDTTTKKYRYQAVYDIKYY